MDNNAYNPNVNFNQPAADPQPLAPAPQPAPAQPMGAPAKPKLNWSTIQIVILAIVGLLAVVFIGLFIWMFIMWHNADSNVQDQIDTAVNAAVTETETKLEAEFTEREKYPYGTFTGPSDYGSLSFEFPKTWSVYIAKDSSSGGDYEAYLNPDVVSPISNDTINALRVTIKDQSIEQVSRSYENLLKQGKITTEVRPINGENANVYTGSLTSKIQGIAAVFKIRDKTAIIQTDALVFQDDFTHVLDTIKYNS